MTFGPSSPALRSARLSKRDAAQLAGAAFGHLRLLIERLEALSIEEKQRRREDARRSLMKLTEALPGTQGGAHVAGRPACECFGEGPPVVLIHGWGVDRTVLAPLARALSAEHRVLLVDLPGHGASAPPVDAVSIEGLASAIAALLPTCELERPIVVGHSLGALIALEIARRGDARAAVLLECHLAPAPAALAPLRPLIARLRSGDRDAAVGLLGFLLGAEVDESDRTRLLAHVSRVPLDLLADVLEAGLDFDSATALGAVRVPLLYVGTGAPYADLAHCKSIAPQLVVDRVVASTHYFPLTAFDQVAAMVRTFVRALP